MTFRGDGWHLLLRELVYAVSTTEAMRKDVERGADPRQDAWVLAATARSEQVVAALDRALELLGAAEQVPAK